MAEPTTVFCFANGQTAVCVDGKQVPRLQKPWLHLVMEFLGKKGLDPVDNVTFMLPHGRIAKGSRTRKGTYNWEISG